jgi:hypothetical protein
MDKLSIELLVVVALAAGQETMRVLAVVVVAVFDPAHSR